MIIAIYKPKGPTSHDIIDRLRKITGERRIGHAGTLDPLAKGVLVVGIGRDATRKLKEIVAKEKEYLATIRLGAESETDDAEGPIREGTAINKPAREEIEKIIDAFRGKILQTPPVYSAIKIRGERAYKLARKSEAPKLKPREVEIKEIEILKYKWPVLKLRVVTGPGVYIRSLARDIGEKLDVGGYLLNLERTRVGEFTKDNSVTLEEFSRRWHNKTKYGKRT